MDGCVVAGNRDREGLVVSGPSDGPNTQALLDNLDITAFYQAQIPGFKVNGHLNVKADCPFECGGGRSFSVDTEKGLFCCHRCDAKGSPWTFLERKGLSPSSIRSALMEHQRGGAARASRRTKSKPDLGPIVKTYDYVDERGAFLFQVTRHDPKDFRQRHRGLDGKWINDIVGVRRVLYGLPGLIDAVKAGWTIYIVEGEKDADAINGLDSGGEFYATTASMGAAAKWLPEYTPFLAGANVVIVADKADKGDVGVKRALDVRFHLLPVAKSVRIVLAKTGKDAFDHIGAGHPLADFVEMPEVGTTQRALASAVVPLSTVIATYPEYDADAAIRRMGLHLWWGPPGNYKTYLALLMALTMTQSDSAADLFDVKAFRIRRRWSRVLWLGDEESAGELRARAEIIARGHGLRPPRGDEFMFADASGGDSFLNISDVPALVDLVKPDAVIVDPLANLTPSTDSKGNAVKVDLDNTHALVTICRPLRRMCKQRGIAVFLSHHPNASGDRERGPTAYRGSADVVMRVALDGPALVLDFGKNRDAKREKIHLEPIWTGHRDSAERPLTLSLRPTVAPIPPDEAGLPDTATKMLAAIRAAGPLKQDDIFDAAPGLHRSTYFRNLGVLRKRELIDITPDKRWIAVAQSRATSTPQSHEETF